MRISAVVFLCLAGAGCPKSTAPPRSPAHAPAPRAPEPPPPTPAPKAAEAPRPTPAPRAPEPPPPTPAPKAAQAPPNAPALGPGHLPGELEVSLMTPKTLADGTRQIRSQVIYLGSNISQAPGTVYLHLGDLTASPGTDARIYLAGLGADTLDPANYIGSFAMVGGGPAGEPVTIASHTLEVTDFEAGGRRYHARSSLRVFGHFGLVVMVKAGSLTIGRAVLSTKALRDRHP